MSRLAELKANSPWATNKPVQKKGRKAGARPKFVFQAKPQAAPQPRRKTGRRRVTVKCLETGEVFDGLVAASQAAGMHDNALSRAFFYARKQGRRCAMMAGKRWEVLA